MNYKEIFLKSINKTAEREIDKVIINQYYLDVLESQDKEIARLKNIIKQIYEIFEKGTFEDNCDCIQIEAIIAEEIKGSEKE